jgi:hypothetical protein
MWQTSGRREAQKAWQESKEKNRLDDTGLERMAIVKRTLNK